MKSCLSSRVGFAVESMFIIAIILGLISDFFYLFQFGYFPSPFFFIPVDTWMDWINTAEYSHVKGAFDTWGTIYPPFSFAFLEFVTNGNCYKFGLIEVRTCDVYGVISLHTLYLIIVLVTALTFIRIDRHIAFQRSVALTMGMPMLFALDRGNLVLMCYLCLLLAYGPLIHSTRIRWFFGACAINLKIYLISTIFAPLIKGRWRWFEGAALMTVLVYLASLTIVGDGTPSQIYHNLVAYSGAMGEKVSIDLAYYPLTYGPVLSLFKGNGFPIADYFRSDVTEFLEFTLPLVTHAVQATVVIAVFSALAKPSAVPVNRLIGHAVALSMITAESGYYALVFLILFVFMEKWQGFGRIYSILVCYFLCLPFDFKITQTPPLVQESFFGGRMVFTEYAIGAGPFVRPALVLSIAAAMSFVTIRQVLSGIWCVEGKRMQPSGGTWRSRRRLSLDPPQQLRSERSK